MPVSQESSELFWCRFSLRAFCLNMSEALIEHLKICTREDTLLLEDFSKDIAQILLEKKLNENDVWKIIYSLLLMHSDLFTLYVCLQGGADQKHPIIVSRVAPGSPADTCFPRLNEGDQIYLINGRDVSQHSHDQVLILCLFIFSLNWFINLATVYRLFVLFVLQVRFILVNWYSQCVPTVSFWEVFVNFNAALSSTEWWFWSSLDDLGY